MDGCGIVFNDQDFWPLIRSVHGFGRLRARLQNGGRDWQTEIEATPAAGYALQAKCSALQFHEALGDGQAQSCALDTVAGFPQAVKSIEDALLLVGRNPRPVITNFPLNLAFKLF